MTELERLLRTVEMEIERHETGRISAGDPVNILRGLANEIREMMLSAGTTHELKIVPRYFRAVQDGRKTVELRKNDRDYRVGDMLILKEWRMTGFTGREVKKRITHIVSDDRWLQPEHVALSLGEVDEDD